MVRIFISYSRADSTFANRIAADLERWGVDVWIDRDDIRSGVDWSDAIHQALRSSNAMILIVTQDSMDSHNVADEWKFFRDSERPLIPVLLKPTINIHFQLYRLQYIDFYQQLYPVALQQLYSELIKKGLPIRPTVYPPPRTTSSRANLETYVQRQQQTAQTTGQYRPVTPSRPITAPPRHPSAISARPKRRKPSRVMAILFALLAFAVVAAWAILIAVFMFIIEPDKNAGTSAKPPRATYAPTITLIPTRYDPPLAVPTPTIAPTWTPSSANPQPCTPRTDWGMHLVQSGETVNSIAIRYGISASALMAANCLINPNLIYAGQLLYVPPVYNYWPTSTPYYYNPYPYWPTSTPYYYATPIPYRASATLVPTQSYSDYSDWIAYTAQPDDTLYSIAAMTGTPVETLARVNLLFYPYQIYPYQLLWVPPYQTWLRTPVGPQG